MSGIESGPKILRKATTSRNASATSLLKAKQMGEVKTLISREMLIPPPLVDSEVKWFFEELGLNYNYFETTDPNETAVNIINLYAAKLLSTSNYTPISLANRHASNATFSLSANQGLTREQLHLEYEIEKEFLSEVYQSGASSQDDQQVKAYKLQAYLTAGTIAPGLDTQLCFYFVSKPTFVDDPVLPGADFSFLRSSSSETKSLYASLIAEAQTQLSPVLCVDTCLLYTSPSPRD
eukprot:TRINITY_DN7021_c0_g1_i1.p1 TRINITY_DN7021_c0_g1~~TRINITY_DN7021_c0_g1_i1.p1  ORF type:complete len:275 (-),score=99.97 TRINITY_DN7021_c0_g1_i1:39-746(-)